MNVGQFRRLVNKILDDINNEAAWWGMLDKEKQVCVWFLYLAGRVPELNVKFYIGEEDL